MGSLLVKVKAKMAIYAHEKVRGVLEGEYGSVFKGRSMDFDDLREYIPGDDVKDIDWKATARSGSTRIRRYIAIRKHNIMLVVDSGLNMTAVTTDGTSKKDTAILLSGVIGLLALKHGDLVGMVAGNTEKSKYFPLKTGSIHLEQLLQELEKTIQPDVPNSNIASQLEYVARNIRRKMIVIVISDEVPFDETLRSVVRRLRAQHEILWLRIGDADLTKNERLADVERFDEVIPAYLRKDKKVIEAFRKSEVLSHQSFTQSLNKLVISSEQVNSEQEAVTKVYKLLERHRSARRT